MTPRVRLGALCFAALIAGLLLWRGAERAVDPGSAAQAGRPAAVLAGQTPPAVAPDALSVAAIRSAPSEATRSDAVAKAAAFQDWVTAFRRADDPAAWDLIARGVELARARREALKLLIETEPKVALAWALPVGLRAELPAGVQAQLEQRVDARGDFAVSYACFGPEERIERGATIAGERYETYVFGRRTAVASKRGMALHGIAVDQRLALDDAPYRLLDDAEKGARGQRLDAVVAMIGGELEVFPSMAEFEVRAETLRSAEASPGPLLVEATRGVGGAEDPATAAATAWVAGAKRVLWIQVDFADDPGAFATSAEIAVTNTAVSDFYAANSQGITSMSFTTLPGVLRMPRDKSFYNASSSTTSQLQTDAVAAAKAYDAANGGTGTYNPDRYDRRLVLFRRIPAYTFGGLADVVGPAVWLNGTISPTTVAHELGHTQGLRHSHYWLPSGASGAGPGVHVEYGDVFDTMGSGAAATAHFSSPQKAVIGYLEGDAITAVSQAGTFRLNRHDHRDAAAVRGLKLVAGDLGYEYWVEHRRQGPASFNNAQNDRLRNGVILHWGPGKAPKFTSGPGSYLVDATAGSAGGANDAPLRMGETFVDPDAGVTIKPLAVGGAAPNEYIDVQVAFGAVDGNHDPVLQASPPSGPLAARTNLIFRASATDPDGDAVYYRWDFGDGRINPNLDNITRRFTKGGTYPLRVSAHDGKGGIAVRNLSIQVTDPLVNWTARDSGVTAMLSDVLFSGGKFVAAGIGLVVTSPDGVTWTRRDAGTTSYGWLGVAHSGTRYVVAGLRVGSTTERGGAAYSDDGITWTLATVPAGVGQMLAVAFGAGRFVAVGENGRIYQSPDGAVWSATTSPITNSLRAVRFADGLFVATGDSGRVLTSTDGVTWVNRSVATSNTLGTVARHNGIWYTSSATLECFKSTDGAAWTRIATAGRTSGTFRLASVSGVLLGTTGLGSITLAEEPQDWSMQQLDATANTTFNGVAEGNGVVVVVGSRGLVYTAASSTPGAALIAAPVLRNDADSLKVAVGRKNILSAGGTGFVKLELYANGTKVSELNASAGALSWTPAALGSYALVVRGITAAGESVVSASVPAIAGLPSWNWRNPSPAGNDLRGAVRVNGKWWIVGDSGTLLTLDAGGVVTPMAFPTTQHLSGIAYANGRFVISGPYSDSGAREEIGSLWTSTDGFAWTPLLTTVFDNFNLTCVAAGGDQWVAASAGGLVLTSSDGLNWTRQISGITTALRAAAYGNGLWVATGDSGRIITSRDGIAWTARTSGVTSALNAVAFRDGQFVVVGAAGVILASTDGATWTRQTSGATGALYGLGVVGDSWVATGDSGLLVTSTNGSTWTAGSMGGNFSGGLFVGGSGDDGLLLGRTGEIYRPVNPRTWNRLTTGTTEARNAVIYAGGKFVAVGATTDPISRATATPVVFSQNGLDWTRAALNTTFTSANVGLNAIAYGQNTYVVCSGAGRIFTSPDANTWTQRDNPASGALQGGAVGPRNFVLVGAGGTILSSADAVTWLFRPSGVTQTLRSAAFGNDRFVAVGDGGTIVTSTDGASWSAATSGVTTALLAVAWWEDVGFLAAGNSGTMLGSPDGVNWQQLETGVSDNISALARTTRGFVASAGTSGTLLVSLDGTSWSIATLPVDRAIRGLAASDSAIVAVGDLGATLTFELVDSSPVPVIVAQPVSQTPAGGQPVTLAVETRNTANAVFQWAKDGVPVFGANSASYVIPALSAAGAGRYTVTVTSPTGTVTSTAAVIALGVSANPGRLVNLSLLTSIDAPGDSFTLGFVVGGSGTSGAKPLVIRAAGPSLGALGVGGTLDDPKLELFAGSNRAGINDNWGGSSSLVAAMAAVGAFPYTGALSKDAALAADITARDSSVTVSAANNGTGLVIAELYDATPTNAFTASTPRLVNVSVLKNLGTGVTAGFVIGGSGARNVLIRAIGPTLGAAPFGVPGVVADPQLALYSGQSKVAENDNWGGTAALTAAFNQVGAFALPAASRDAALLVNLQPGSYTVQVSGVANTSGIALIEVYEVP